MRFTNPTFSRIALLLMMAPAAWAQPQLAGPSAQRLNLRECIDIALKNNITVRQGQLQVEGNTVQLRQSRNNLLPNVGFQANQSLSKGGRQIDPFTNIVIPPTTVNSSNYGLNGSITVFNGFALRNTIKQNDLAVQASEQELNVTRNNVALNVVQQYLNVLTGNEQLAIAQRQADITRAQLERTQRQVTAGSLPEANLYDIRAQLANNELDIVNAQNQVDLAKLALLQAMNVPVQPIEVQSIEVPDPSVEPYGASVETIYETAANTLPDLRGADLRIRSAKAGIEVARSAFYPILTLNGSLFTLYTSTATVPRLDTSNLIRRLNPRLIGIIGNQPIPVYDVVPSQTGEFSIPYFNQITGNLNRSVTATLRLPILNNNQARNRVVTARIQQQNAELDAQNIRLQLRQQIETAYTNMRAAANRYRAQQAQVTSLEQAFRVSESRFNAGALNAVDYNIAKTNLDRARAALVQSKYDYVFRTKILDFYQNKPLTF